jgi:predicted permease
MPDWRAQIRARIGQLGLDPTREAELAEELGQHLEDRYQDLIERGASAAAAEAAVVREHLDEGALRMALMSSEPPARSPGPVLGGESRSWLGGLRSDLWFAVRALIRAPGLAAIVLLTLAIGIGANVMVFSVVNALLLRPLPFHQSDRLVSFWGSAPEKRLPVVNYPDALYDYYRKRARTIDPFAFYNAHGVTLSRAGEAERIDASEVTTDFFRLLGVSPLHGRTFLAEENVAGAPLVVVLSHGLWQRRFGGDPAIVGQSIRVDETAATVVGVMPWGFDFPYRSQLWLPLGIDATSLNCWCYDAIGRLAPGQTSTDLVREIEGLNADFWAEREGRPRKAPDASASPGTIVVPLSRQQVGDLRTPVLVLLGAVGAVLLIACANLASLLLVRAVGRSREIAVRTALGASPWRIVRQITAETGLLAVGGRPPASWSAGSGSGCWNDRWSTRSRSWHRSRSIRWCWASRWRRHW